MLILLLTTACLLPQEPRFPSFPEQDALSYDIELDVSPADAQISGRVGYRFRAVEDLATIRLHSKPGDHWNVKFLDDRGFMISRWQGDVVTITLRDKVAAGDIVDFRATLDGTPPEGFYFADNRYGQQLAFTDHYSIRARGWLPCEDHPGDRASFSVVLTYPHGLEAAASGVAAELRTTAPPPERERLMRSTVSDIPPYMFAIAVGPFARLDEGGDPRLRPHLIYGRDRERAEAQLVHHATWMRLMEETFGSYAYGKYLVVQCPTRWGGFEAPGVVLVSEQLFDSPRGVGTLAHEFTHMWFGDAVGYAEWREVWLSEGFASYFGPWLHEFVGGPTLTDSMREMRERWLRSREGVTRTIRWDGFPHPDLALNANTYPKGAWVLHMLRSELGEEVFFQAIRSYYERFRGTSVTTAEFITAIEASAGRDLGWFFEQWLERVGSPVLRVTTEGNGVVVEQTQRSTPYRFPLTLRWTEGGLRQQRIVQITERRTEVEISGDFSDLAVDPDVQLLFRPAK